MKDLGKLLKEAKKVQARVAELHERLAEKRIEASAGGGMVKVVMNGRHEVLSVHIDREVVNPSDIEMLEDLVSAAVNEARSRVDEMIKEEMSTLTGGLPIPGLF